MVPGKPEDFTSPHGGFEGEKKCQRDDPAYWTIQIFDNDGNLLWRYSSTPWRGFRWSPDTPGRIYIDPLPLPDRDTE